MLDFLKEYESAFWILGIASGVLLVASLFIIPAVLIRLPADYFTRPRHRRGPRRPQGTNPASASTPARPRSPRSTALKIGRNVLGAAIILAGIAMLILPGQGILAILLGLMLIDFPGKFRLLRAIIRRKTVHRPLNRLRTRRGRPPLKIP